MEYTSPKEGGPLWSFYIRLFFAGICGLSAVYTPSYASPVPMVRVLVERESQGLSIQGFDLIFNDASSNRRIGHADGRSTVPVKCKLGGKMELRVGGSTLVATGAVHVESLGGFIRIGSSQYRDGLYLHSFNGDCVVVNHVDLEKYVAGLLNSEMSAKWNLQTLMAQAVAARTYALYQMNESSTTRYRGLRPLFDLDSSVKDQVYEGAHQERYRALQAVQLTRGQIMTFEGKPIKAFYHSTCGGHTESAERVWGRGFKYIEPVTCGFCDRSPRFNWTYAVDALELQGKLRRHGLVKGDLVAMRVTDRNGIGRANQIEIRGSQGSTVVRAVRLRDLLGTLNLRSTNFTVEQSGTSIAFQGHGSGHGVGMCQWGAKGMADKGRTFTEILKHYYPRAVLTKRY